MTDNIRNLFIAELMDMGKADKLLRALERRGLRIVPVEPTEAMLDAGWAKNGDVVATYRAMLAATRPEGEMK